jgi:hypothetical protein
VAGRIEELRAQARLDRLPDLELLVGSVSGDQLAALEVLALCWPPERGPVPEAAVRRCLGWPDPHGVERSP